jgi:hypothetical protein
MDKDKTDNGADLSQFGMEPMPPLAGIVDFAKMILTIPRECSQQPERA